MKTLLILLGVGGLAFWQRKRIAGYLLPAAASTAASAASSVASSANDAGTNFFVNTFSV